MWGLESESQRTRKQLPVAEAWWVGCVVLDKGPAPSPFQYFCCPGYPFHEQLPSIPRELEEGPGHGHEGKREMVGRL